MWPERSHHCRRLGRKAGWGDAASRPHPFARRQGGSWAIKDESTVQPFCSLPAEMRPQRIHNLWSLNRLHITRGNRTSLYNIPLLLKARLESASDCDYVELDSAATRLPWGTSFTIV